jgi:hypothetical protein
MTTSSSRTRRLSNRAARNQLIISSNSAQIVTLYSQGKDAREIAAELDCDFTPLMLWIRKNCPYAVYRAHRIARTQMNAILYTDDDCVQALKLTAQRLGFRPTMSGYNANRRKTDPCAHTIRVRIGWSRACVLAGLDRPVDGVSPSKWSRDDVALVVQDFCLTFMHQHGYIPKVGHYEEWARGSDDRPSAGLVRRHFGAWTHALREAGVV